MRIRITNPELIIFISEVDGATLVVVIKVLIVDETTSVEFLGKEVWVLHHQLGQQMTKLCELQHSWFQPFLPCEKNDIGLRGKENHYYRGIPDNYLKRTKSLGYP